MRLLNRASVPRYSPLANATLKPGMASRDMDTFSKAWESVLAKSRGFDIILSDNDIHLLATLCGRFLVKKAGNAGADPSVRALMETLRDPDGLKKAEAEALARRASLQKARAQVLREYREKEARIRSESNIIGPDGNPVPHVREVSRTGEKIDPKLHPEMSNDLKSVIENNLAVMRTASGKPIADKAGPHTVVARPGGSPVSHNPDDYRKGTKAASGQPDYFN